MKRDRKPNAAAAVVVGAVAAVEAVVTAADAVAMAVVEAGAVVAATAVEAGAAEIVETAGTAGREPFWMT
jgi:hypothetical protein